MKPIYILIAGAVVISTVVGASLATISRQDPPPEPTSAPQISSATPSSAPQVETTTPPVPADSTTGDVQTTTAPTTVPIEVETKPKPHNPSRQLITLVDEVKPGSEFDQFRQQVRQAITKRDAEFIRSILPADQIGIGQGVRTVKELNLESPEEHFWNILEKAITPGCSPYQLSRPDVAPGSLSWVCNNIPEAFARQFPPPKSAEGVSYQLSRMVIVGKNINVRSQPSTDSPVVGTLSHEVVKVNRQIQEKQSQERVERGEEYDPLNDWTAVILPNRQPGYVSNRFAYSPLEYQAVFGKVKGQWQLLYLPGGD